MLWKGWKGQERRESIFNRKPRQQRRIVTEGSQEVAGPVHTLSGAEDVGDYRSWATHTRQNSLCMGAVLDFTMTTRLQPCGHCVPQQV